MNFNPNRRRSDIHLDVTTKSFKYKKYLKKFTVGRLNSLGRSQGMIVMAHKGGGVKKKFRFLNNYQQTIPGIVRSIEYDPNRTSRIGLIQYQNGIFSNRIYSSKNYIGQILQTYNAESNKMIKWGDILKLRDIPIGIPFHNVESYPGSGPTYSRAAGTYSMVLGKGNIRARIMLSSKRHFALNLNCSAILGICSNKYHRLKKKYKAGTNRLLNKRPVVRGVAMNPVDHPHGGGEGKGRPGRPSVSPWGKLTKGVRPENFDKTKKKLVKMK